VLCGRAGAGDHSARLDRNPITAPSTPRPRVCCWCYCRRSMSLLRWLPEIRRAAASAATSRRLPDARQSDPPRFGRGLNRTRNRQQAVGERQYAIGNRQYMARWQMAASLSCFGFLPGATLSCRRHSPRIPPNTSLVRAALVRRLLLRRLLLLLALALGRHLGRRLLQDLEDFLVSDLLVRLQLLHIQRRGSRNSLDAVLRDRCAIR
jgi:hypothetical protein